VPSVVDSSGVSAVIPVPFDAAEDARFAASAEAVRQSIATLGL
jgi:malate/lactate dehydrogenase